MRSVDPRLQWEDITIRIEQPKRTKESYTERQTAIQIMQRRSDPGPCNENDALNDRAFFGRTKSTLSIGSLNITRLRFRQKGSLGPLWNETSSKS